MKKLYIYTASISLATISHAATLAVDDFDDNSIDTSLWEAQDVTFDQGMDILTFREQGQVLGLYNEQPYVDSYSTSLRQTLTTNISASLSWQANVDIRNDIALAPNPPSARIGLVVSDSSLTNFGGVYLKADDGARRLQNADFSDLSTSGVLSSGSISLNYNHVNQILTVGYANGIGNTVINYETIDTSAWNNTAANGFRFHLQATMTDTVPSIGDASYDNFSIQSVPEPSSAILLSIGMISFLRRRR